MYFRQGEHLIVEQYADGTVIATVYNNICLYQASKNKSLSDSEVVDVEATETSAQPRAPDVLVLPDGTIGSVLSDGVIIENMDSINPDQSLANSLARTKRKVFDYSHNMNVQYFGTLLFSENNGKVDRYDLDACRKYLSEQMHYYRKYYAPDLQYLWIPEFHPTSGAVHFHGLLGNTGMLQIVPGINHKKDSPFYGKELYRYGLKVYNLLNWSVGFSDLSMARNRQRCSNYILKYITKDLCSSGWHRQRYLVSKNIMQPSRIEDCFIDFENNPNMDHKESKPDVHALVQSLIDADLSYTNFYKVEIPETAGNKGFKFFVERFIYNVKEKNNNG